jgi:hypothetical protein
MGLLCESLAHSVCCVLVILILVCLLSHSGLFKSKASSRDARLKEHLPPVWPSVIKSFVGIYIGQLLAVTLSLTKA